MKNLITWPSTSFQIRFLRKPFRSEISLLMVRPDRIRMFLYRLNSLDAKTMSSMKVSHFFDKKSNFFLRKTKIFSVFSLLRLSVYSTRKYCMYFKMAKLRSENGKKQRNQSLVILTLNVCFLVCPF
jgi:hypothetical protein